MSKLLKEFNALNVDKELVREAKENNKPVVVKALLQRAEARNQNGRVYPKTILEREVENYKKLVQERRSLGECDHPESSVVSLDKASHLVTDIWWEGNDVFGQVELLNTPKGDLVKNLIESGVRLGISSRGVGDVMKNENGEDVVQEDFMLICFDLVSEPSTHNAFLFKEGKEVSADQIKSEMPKTYRVNRLLNDILKK